MWQNHELALKSNTTLPRNEEREWDGGNLLKYGVPITLDLTAAMQRYDEMQAIKPVSTVFLRGAPIYKLPDKSPCSSIHCIVILDPQRVAQKASIPLLIPSNSATSLIPRMNQGNIYISYQVLLKN